ncbi:MAG: ROK family protein [Microbacterium sp.]
MADPLAPINPASGTKADSEGASFVLDIGGTWTRASCWPLSAEEPIRMVRTPSRTNHPETPADQLIDQLVDLIVSMAPATKGSKVAISLGAALDHDRGVVYGSAPLWGDSATDVPISARLNARVPNVQWVVKNDVTAMLASYRAVHSELDASKIAVVTVSSGIAARYDDPSSRIMPTDPAGLQGEIGHLPAVTNDLHLECACGVSDHVAAFASGPGIRAVAGAIAMRADPDVLAVSAVVLSPEEFERTFAAALDADDPFAHSVLREAVNPIADVFTYLLTTQPDIERIVMAGGVIESIGVHYRRAVLRRMRHRGVYHTSSSHPAWLESVIVLARSPQETSPLVGAAILAGADARRATWIQ